MCSEAAGTPTSRCLLCSLGCATRLEQFAPQRWRPLFDGTGPCARGQLLADLVQSPTRLYRPQTRAGQPRLATLLDELRERLTRTDSRTAVWLDGNVALEDLAAAHAFAKSCEAGCDVLVHLPPAERGAAAGLTAAGVPQADPADWENADAFLVVGNPLATHPACARWLLRSGPARARTPCVVIDASAGFLTSYAQHTLLCRPGCEAWTLAALLATTVPQPQSASSEHSLADTGVSRTALDQAAERLATAQRPAVILAPQAGSHAAWRTLAEQATTWARDRHGTISVLTTSANALGVTPLMHKLDLRDWCSSLAADTSTSATILLVVGWDPTSAYPRAVWEPAFAAAEEVILADTFPPADPLPYDAWLPLALPSEAGGTYLLADGQTHDISGMIAPPAGVPTVRQLFAHLAGAPGEASVWQLPEGATTHLGAAPEAGPLAPPQPTPVHSWPAVLIADPTQYADGHMTRHATWSARADLLPELRIAPADARRLNLADGQTTLVANAQGQARVRVTLAAQPAGGGCYGDPSPVTGQRTGWLALQNSSPEVRALGTARAGHADDSTDAGLLHIDFPECASCATPEEVRHDRV